MLPPCTPAHLPNKLQRAPQLLVAAALQTTQGGMAAQGELVAMNCLSSEGALQHTCVAAASLLGDTACCTACSVAPPASNTHLADEGGVSVQIGQLGELVVAWQRA